VFWEYWDKLPNTGLDSLREFVDYRTDNAHGVAALESMELPFSNAAFIECFGCERRGRDLQTRSGNSGGERGELAEDEEISEGGETSTRLSQQAMLRASGHSSGSRLTTVFVPSRSGDHIFALASDAQGELWLSPALTTEDSSSSSSSSSSSRSSSSSSSSSNHAVDSDKSQSQERSTGTGISTISTISTTSATSATGMYWERAGQALVRIATVATATTPQWWDGLPADAASATAIGPAGQVLEEYNHWGHVSAPIWLEAGQAYLLQAIHKAGRAHKSTYVPHLCVGVLQPSGVVFGPIDPRMLQELSVPHPQPIPHPPPLRPDNLSLFDW